MEAGAVDAAFARADAVVGGDFTFARHTGVCLEPRSILAEFDAGRAPPHAAPSSQAPHMMKEVALRHFRLPEPMCACLPRCRRLLRHQVHIYADEMAAIALALLLGRPVKFVADRLNPSSPTFMPASTASRRAWR